MVRAKKPTPDVELDDKSMADAEEEQVDYTARYSAPFTIYDDNEGVLFQKFDNSEITHPHYLDWELIRSLKVEAKVKQYLDILGLTTLANVDYSGYDPLCYEFMTSMCLDADKRKITVRMKGIQYAVSLAKMKQVFGFPTIGVSEKSSSFNVNEVWTELTGFKNWNNSGVPNGFLKDPALAIVHKFIAYNVSGKEQANRVNSTEVFLLSCALHGTKVRISNFIWDAMVKMQTRPLSRASLCPIVTGLAHHFGVISSTSGGHSGYKELLPYSINLKELKWGHFVYDRHRFVPQEERHCVKAFINSEIAKGLRHPVVPSTSDVGPSTAANGAEDEDEEPLSPEPQPPLTMSGDGFRMFQNELQSFREHFDSSLGTFRKEMNSRFDQYNASLGEFRQEVGRRFDAQDQQIATLQAQFNAWTSFYPPPPPPQSGDGFQMFQNELQSFREHFDSSLGTFREEMNSRYDQYNASLGEFRQEVGRRFDAQDQPPPPPH